MKRHSATKTLKTSTKKYKKILIASDHAGFALKNELIGDLKKYTNAVIDLGPDSAADIIDYPKSALKLVSAMQDLTLNESHNLSKSEIEIMGILICGSGVGMSIAANRFAFINAALCATIKYAKLARMHNNSNLLVLGARIISTNKAKKILNTFLNTKFSFKTRHKKRIEQLSKLPSET